MLAIREVLTESRDFGFLGPGPVDAHIEHALGMAAALLAVHDGTPPSRVLDLGAGGGVPGLVLAALWPEVGLLLLDASVRRARFLESAVDGRGWSARVTVRCARAEAAGRDPGLRTSFDAVVARGFGPPATTAECAAPFLRLGGLLVVSEPPGPVALRWPPDGCALVGLAPERRFDEPVATQVLRQADPCGDGYPRRDGVPAKRPLF